MTQTPMQQKLWHTVLEDLRPFDGRLAITWRIAIVCSLTAMMFMNYQVPLVSIGCYLIMFLAKPNAQENMLVAIAIGLLVSLIIPLLLFLAKVSIDQPMWRLIIIVLGSYIFVFIGAASIIGEGGNIVALVIGFAMTLLPFTPIGEMITRGILYAWLMVLIPMGVMFVFHLFAGRSSRVLLCHELAKRVNLIADLLQDTPRTGDNNEQALQTALYEGMDNVKNLLKLTRLFHLIPKAQSQAAQNSIDNSQDLLIALTDPKARQSMHQTNPDLVKRLGKHCRQIAELLHANKLAQAILLSRPSGEVAKRSSRHLDDPLAQNLMFVAHTVDHLFDVSRHDRTSASQATIVASTSQPAKSPVKGILKPDAWSNPEYSRFAIKTTAAAVISYIIYTSIQWDGIHTAMITCYVAALGTTGETVHKLALRIVGCLIGAAMGIASIAWLMPLMTSVGQLMLLVFAGVMIAAWVSSGSERTSYAGIQIGLAFLMTVLQGFGPDVDIAVATDRIYGILLGNAIMFILFTHLWPTPVITSVRRAVERAIKQLQQWDDGSATEDTLTQRRSGIDQILINLAKAKDTLAYSHFEPKQLRLSQAQHQHWVAGIRSLETLTLQLARLDQGARPNAHDRRVIQDKVSLLWTQLQTGQDSDLNHGASAKAQ